MCRCRGATGWVEREVSAGWFVLVLLAALLHAGWNALLKVNLDRFLSASLIQIFAGLVALCALPWAGWPTPAMWGWIGLSAVLHVAYNLCLIQAYRHGDLGQAYPLARGGAPLLASLAAWWLLGERLAPPGVCGLLLLAAGIGLMALRGGTAAGTPRRPLLLSALATSGCIAGYTLCDASGARAAGAPWSYALWLFVVNGAVAMALLALVRGPRVLLVLGPHWRAGLAGGAMSMLAYTLVIVATTHAAVGLVSALRESSVLFALLIGAFRLREPLPPGRLMAALLIVAGVVGIRLA